jgi:hypothetical protein
MQQKNHSKVSLKPFLQPVMHLHEFIQLTRNDGTKYYTDKLYLARRYYTSGNEADFNNCMKDIFIYFDKHLNGIDSKYRHQLYKNFIIYKVPSGKAHDPEAWEQIYKMTDSEYIIKRLRAIWQIAYNKNETQSYELIGKIGKQFSENKTFEKRELENLFVVMKREGFAYNHNMFEFYLKQKN